MGGSFFARTMERQRYDKVYKVHQVTSLSRKKAALGRSGFFYGDFKN